jgi:hypothetical protein
MVDKNIEGLFFLIFRNKYSLTLSYQSDESLCDVKVYSHSTAPFPPSLKLPLSG